MTLALYRTPSQFAAAFLFHGADCFMHASMRHQTIQGYVDAAPQLIARYEALSSSELFAPVEHLFPEEARRVIDLGAGAGRDAAWFAAKGHAVLAVEPAAPFREAGALLHRSAGIEWLDDALPEIPGVMARNETFDLVLLHGVWQHIDAPQRRAAMRNIRELTAPSGLLVFSVRHGPGAPGRPCFEASAEETIDLGLANGFQLMLSERRESVQPENRAAGVEWTWLAFSLDAPGG